MKGVTAPPAAFMRRPETAADVAFRFALFCGSRQPHESLAGPGAALEEQLMRHQSAGQQASSRAAYPAARHDIVEVDGTPVGRIIVDEGARPGRSSTSRLLRPGAAAGSAHASSPT